MFVGTEPDMRLLHRALSPNPYLRSKRLFDVVVSASLLVLLSPLFVVIGLGVLLDDGGPIVYRQERLGLCGKVFVMYKFRSMNRTAEEITGPVWAAVNDERITRWGALLRRTRLDELPQLVNVVLGDMSLIGPRPERPILSELFSRDIPTFPVRLLVRPGITGLAQVRGGYDLTPVDKLKHDMHYISSMSWRLDLMILAATAKVMLFGSGAR